ncbi:DMT family transporter [Sphingobacterium composti Ten et al. 2007 non Yoo et al. 2007]|uniref:DMT family transporter n=1 Tax=Sphingobacterium composti TaxID=363260 RepID=UPI00135B9C87|nr:DMT family transporter [Sphingobacterium composti Ten et al. 2007 non Yoo et al. 2007]
MNFFTRNRNLFILHFTVLIWGFTGVLGSLISTPALQLVWYRVLIAALTLIGYHFIIRKEMVVPTKDILKFMGVGLLVGLHWVLFFQAIKVSTVSVTLVTLSSLTLFTSILEPLFYRRKLSIGDIIVGVVIIFGIYLIFKFEFQYWLGISLGLGAALCASVFSILNGKMVQKTSPSIITQYEMIGAFIGLSIVLLVTGQFDNHMILSSTDFFYLFLLGSVCTALAYVLGVAVMKELTAFTVALVTNLEPVYGIVLAFFFIGSTEKMSVGFYAGAIIILSAVFVYPTLKTKIQNFRATV